MFRAKKHAYSEGGKKLSLARKPSFEALTVDEIAIVDAVAELYGHITPEDLGYLTKQMNTEIPLDSWGSNREASVDEDAFLRLSPDWHRLCAKIGAEDLDDRSRWSEPINDDPMEHFLRALNA